MGPAERFMFEGHDHTVCETVRRLIKPALLEAAWTEKDPAGRSLATRLMSAGLIEKEALLQAVADYLGCPYLVELPANVRAEVLALVEPGLARNYGVVPLSGSAGSVTVVAVDPFHPQLGADLAFALGRDVRVAVADPQQVRALMKRVYDDASNLAHADAGILSDQLPGTTEAELSEADIAQLAGQTPVIRFVNLVLTQAINDKASDLHFEPFASEFKIRYRVDGALYEMAPPAKSLALPVISRLKVMANLNIAERRLPQDGRIKLNLGGRAVDLRMSTLPTQFGESVVLRVLDQSSSHLDLGEIGLPAAIRLGVEEIIHRPNGIFVVTGPTGSGKTTTLYSCLKALNTIEAKLLSVEDPVEYEIEGVMQVPVNLPAGLTFARALRTFLRQDPDVVMVGEIRDLETAQIAIQASLTGHLVLSTLHTNDAPGTVTRLVDMGIERFLLASSLEAVLAQRLVRRICLSCKTAHEPTAVELRQLGRDRVAVAGRPLYSGTGCAACHQTGYKGRLGLFEFMRLTDPLRELIMNGASVVGIRQKAIEQGMIPLRVAALAAILSGETTVEEVAKYT